MMFSSVLSLFLATAAVINAAPIKIRDSAPKRVLAWDYTNTQNGAIAPHIAEAKVGASQMVGVLNWNTWVPQELEDKSKFQPTIRTLAQASGQDWQFAVDHCTAFPGSIVHTFNEPERNGISAQVAADFWNGQFAQLRRDTGAKLITPAIANTEEGRLWLNDFMSKIGANPPDFLGLHFYDSVPDNALNYFHARFAEHSFPIVVSEIGSNNQDAGAVEAMTRQLANEMDNEPNIFQYAFFGAMAVLPQDGGFIPPSALLLNVDGTFKSLLHDLVNNASL